ncbi:MAG TPA: GNAT family N-acetyltransferase [Anaerolineae bacterium]|nr:GNAT family N-acetyltransferase [Anaerolineae bacterium]
MPNILNDFSEAALITAIEANLLEMLSALFSRLPNSLYQDDADLAWFISDVSHPLFNGVIHARLTSDRLDGRVRESVMRFKAQNKPMLWWTGPATRPHNLGSALCANGLLHLMDTPGMAVDLETLNKDLTLNPALTVKRVNSPDEVKQWLEPYAASFELPRKIVPQLYEAMLKVGLDEAGSLHHYLGLLNGEAVGSSTLYLAAGVAGVYNVGTLPRMRRQGVGTAMALTPLCAAHERGYRIGILHATEQGYPIYRRLGFKEFCTIGQYLYLPNRAQRTFLRFYLRAEHLLKSIKRARR